MGTWSVGSFGNDSAGDWLIDLLENPTYQFIRNTLLASIEGENYSLLKWLSIEKKRNGDFSVAYIESLYEVNALITTIINRISFEGLNLIARMHFKAGFCVKN